MGQDNGHGAVFIQLVQHVLDKGEISLGFRGKRPVLAEPVIIHMQRVGRPLGKKRWVGHHNLETPVDMLGMFQRILLAQVEVALMHPVQNHVHPRKVERRAVHFLPKEIRNLDLALDTQQQRPRPASRIINRRQAHLPC